MFVLPSCRVLFDRNWNCTIGKPYWVCVFAFVWFCIIFDIKSCVLPNAYMKQHRPSMEALVDRVWILCVNFRSKYRMASHKPVGDLQPMPITGHISISHIAISISNVDYICQTADLLLRSQAFDFHTILNFPNHPLHVRSISCVVPFGRSKLGIIIE